MMKRQTFSAAIFLIFVLAVASTGADRERFSAVRDMTSFSRSDQGLSLALTYPSSIPLSQFPQQNFGVVITNTTDHPLSLFIHRELLLLELYDPAGRLKSVWGGNAKPGKLTAHDLITLGPHRTTTRLLHFAGQPLAKLRPGTYTLHATLLDIPSVWPKDIIRRKKKGQIQMWLGSQVQSPDAKIQLVGSPAHRK